MKWKYRIIQLSDGKYITQFKAKGIFGLFGWSTPMTHETYLEAQAFCKNQIQFDREREAMKTKKGFKIIEIFE